MNLGLENKIAVITGGSKGIGKAIGDSLRAEGVIVFSISRTGYFDFKSDLSTLEGLNSAKEYIKQTKPHILINNVGGVGRRPIRMYNYKEAYDMNIRPMLELTHEFLNHNPERIVTISSIYGKEAGNNPWFTSAKAYQIAWSKEMARQHRQDSVTFNIVCPGEIDVRKVERKNYFGNPEDVGNLVTYLCSKQAKHINGACIVCDGGESHAF